LTYNGFDQTTSISSQSLSYAGFNQFELLNRAGTDYNNNVLGLSQNGTTYYVRDTDSRPIVQRTSSRRYFLQDGLGSTRALTDSAGNVLSRYEYEPFGAEEAPAPSGTVTAPRYSGAEYSTSLNIYKMGMRWYDPINQRWTQQDQVEGPANPRTVNRYMYVGGDPVNLADPLGLAPCSEIGTGGTPAAGCPEAGARGVNSRGSAGSCTLRRGRCPVPRRLSTRSKISCAASVVGTLGSGTLAAIDPEPVTKGIGIGLTGVGTVGIATSC